MNSTTTKPKPLFVASDKQRAALAARRQPTAAEVLPKPAVLEREPRNNRVENEPSYDAGVKFPHVAKQLPAKQAEDRGENNPDLPTLNLAQIAGQARRKAQWERQHRVALVREQLISKFPLCFKSPGETKLPLKIGIRQDVMIAMPDISHNDLKLALADYTRDKTYRAVLVEGAARIGLDGAVTGLVTATEAWPHNHEKPPANEAGG